MACTITFIGRVVTKTFVPFDMISSFFNLLKPVVMILTGEELATVVEFNLYILNFIVSVVA